MPLLPDRYARAGVLFAFCINTACNSFMFMDFAALSDLSAEIFKTDTNGVNWLWSASLLAVLPMTFPATFLLPKRGWANWLTTGAGVTCNVVGAWLRYLSVVTESLSVAILSSILVGFSAAVIISSIMHVSANWFPPKQQAMATSVAVQSNYAGWCLGVVLIPLVVTKQPTTALQTGAFRDLLLVQAFVVTASLPAFLLFHRSAPEKKGQYLLEGNGTTSNNDGGGGGGRGGSEKQRFLEEGSGGDPAKDPATSSSSSSAYSGEGSYQQQEGGDGAPRISNTSTHVAPPESFFAQLGMMFTNRHFVFQGFVYGWLGGISFTLTAVQDEVLGDAGLSPDQTCWTNFAFVLCGVIGGLLSGYVVGPRIQQHGRYLKVG